MSNMRLPYAQKNVSSGPWPHAGVVSWRVELSLAVHTPRRPRDSTLNTIEASYPSPASDTYISAGQRITGAVVVCAIF
jgi:hypothetical protein